MRFLFLQELAATVSRPAGKQRGARCSLRAIAEKYLKSGSRYKERVSLNRLKSSVIYSGMKLKIPNK